MAPPLQYGHSTLHSWLPSLWTYYQGTAEFRYMSVLASHLAASGDAVTNRRASFFILCYSCFTGFIDNDGKSLRESCKVKERQGYRWSDGLQIRREPR